MVETIAIRTDADIVEARRRLREIAGRLSYSAADLAMVATAISELARNILEYAGKGEIELTVVRTRASAGILVIARDDGPGIADIGLAMQDGFTTSNGLGLGLPGSRRLVDVFDIESSPGLGTTVRLTKWA